MDYPKLDKSKWGPGPWQKELDFLHYIHAGFDCLIIRHPELGHLCGYVGVPEGHLWYGKDGSDCTKGCKKCKSYEHYVDSEIEVHGGITWARGFVNFFTPKKPSWFFGFDSGHCDDTAPGLRAYGINFDWQTYKNFGYIRKEVNRLAEQLAVAGVLNCLTISKEKR